MDKFSSSDSEIKLWVNYIPIEGIGFLPHSPYIHGCHNFKIWAHGEDCSIIDWITRMCLRHTFCLPSQVLHGVCNQASYGSNHYLWGTCNMHGSGTSLNTTMEHSNMSLALFFEFPIHASWIYIYRVIFKIERMSLHEGLGTRNLGLKQSFFFYYPWWPNGSALAGRVFWIATSHHHPCLPLGIMILIYFKKRCAQVPLGFGSVWRRTMLWDEFDPLRRSLRLKLGGNLFLPLGVLRVS